MENSTPAPQTNNTKPAVIGIALVVIVIIGIVFYQNSSSEAPTQTVVEQPQGQTPTATQQVGNSQEYTDGIYTADGNYISPGGEESIGVSLTIENGVITDSTFTPMAQRPISVTMQDNFASGYQEQIIGKNIDEVELTKVSGSSLTPVGFMDALEKIKAEARS